MTQNSSFTNKAILIISNLLWNLEINIFSEFWWNAFNLQRVSEWRLLHIHINQALINAENQYSTFVFQINQT